MGEVILAGKKNMLLFAGCFNVVGFLFFFFPQPDQFPDPVRRAGTESCAWLGGCRTAGRVSQKPLPQVLCTTGDTLVGLMLPFDKHL